MSAHWKELLPVDHYSVQTPASLDFSHLKILSALYQPLIGPLACQLYTTLLFEADDNEHDRSHYHLMLSTASSLEVLFTERKKLEAIGLLSVYKKKSEEASAFIYELNPPLEPSHFFSDGLLNIYLFNRVGKTEYFRLKSQFTPLPQDREGYEEMTATFNTVFSSIRPSELTNVHLELEDSQGQADLKTSSGPKLSVDFDFSELLRYLSDVIISEESMTEPVRQAIQQLSFVYNIGPEEMAQIIQQAFIHTGEVDISVLRKAVRNYYQIENGDQLPHLSMRAEKKAQEEEKPPESDYEAQIRLFETLSPYDLLRNMAGGAEPVQSDLRIVEGLLFDQHLSPGVVNVLLDYTMLVNDKRLIKGYIEKIASHWARKKVQTVREAMALAKSEHKKYQDWKQPQTASNRTAPSTKRQTNARQDRLPKWMKNEMKQSKKEAEPEPNAQPPVKEKDEEREKWLENFLNNL